LLVLKRERERIKRKGGTVYVQIFFFGLVFHMLLYIYSLLKVIFARNIIKQKREREGEGEREIYKGGLEGEIVENQFFLLPYYIF
jgi:hypothetical protein